MGIELLLGKTLITVDRSENDDEITFETDEYKSYRMFHEQDCCEQVSIEDIEGDLQDLVGEPITLAEESSNNDNPKDTSEYADGCTWTFYKLATKKGYVTIRWYGTSNGYYSERVDFKEIT